MSTLSVVITGSTRGIGKGLAAEVLKRGHNVIISGRTRQAVDAAVAELSPLATAGARVTGHPATSRIATNCSNCGMQGSPRSAVSTSG